jgi:hypothetical protein
VRGGVGGGLLLGAKMRILTSIFRILSVPGGLGSSPLLFMLTRLHTCHLVSVRAHPLTDNVVQNHHPFRAQTYAPLQKAAVRWYVWRSPTCTRTRRAD